MIPLESVKPLIFPGVFFRVGFVGIIAALTTDGACIKLNGEFAVICRAQSEAMADGEIGRVVLRVMR